MSSDGAGFPDITSLSAGEAAGFGQSAFGEGLSSWVTDGSPGTSGLSFGFLQKMSDGSFLPDFAVMLHALQTDEDVNILATPQILTMDNEEAKIKVVQNVPYLSKLETTSDSSDNYLQDIDYKDVGIELTITPHVSKAQMVRMETHVKISSLVGGSLESGVQLYPTTYDRETETAVIVKDNHTIVIGGLIRDDWTDTEDKVPILGDIPLVGNLFRSTSETKETKNLLIFLTPRVVRTTQQIADLTNLKRMRSPKINERLKEQEEELAAQVEEERQKEGIDKQDLKARSATQLQSLRDYELAHPPAVDAETAAREKLLNEEEASNDQSSDRSLLDSLPKVSFGRKEESNQETGTGRFYK
jgi:general secretion pathway protein D